MKPKRIWQNRDGVSLGSVVMLLLLIGATVGIYLYIYTDYFTPAESEVYGTIYLKDKIDNEKHYLADDFSTYWYEAGHLYQLVLETNAPYKPLSSYHWNIEAWYYDGTDLFLTLDFLNNDTAEILDVGNYNWHFLRESINIGYSSILQNTFSRDVNLTANPLVFQFGGTDFQFNLFQCELVSPAGNVITSGNILVIIHADEF